MDIRILIKKNESFQDCEVYSNSLWILILEFLEAIDKSCEIFKKSYLYTVLFQGE